MKRKTLPVAGMPGRDKEVKTNTLKIYNRLIREVTLQTSLRPQKCNALFDTGANIFVLDDKWATQFSLSYLEHDEPLRVFRFWGQQDHTAGKYFALSSAKKNCDSLSQESQESLLRLLRLLRQTIAISFADVSLPLSSDNMKLTSPLN